MKNLRRFEGDVDRLKKANIGLAPGNRFPERRLLVNGKTPAKSPRCQAHLPRGKAKPIPCAIENGISVYMADASLSPPGGSPVRDEPPQRPGILDACHRKGFQGWRTYPGLLATQRADTTPTWKSHRKTKELPDVTSPSDRINLEN